MQGGKTALLSKLLDFIYLHLGLETVSQCTQCCKGAVIKSVSEDGTSQSLGLTLLLRWHSRLRRCKVGRKTLSRVFPHVMGCDPFPKGSFGRQNCSMLLLQGCSIRKFACFNRRESKNSRFKWRDLKSRSPCGLRAGTEHSGSTSLIGNRALVASEQQEPGPELGWDFLTEHHPCGCCSSPEEG